VPRHDLEKKTIHKQAKQKMKAESLIHMTTRGVLYIQNYYHVFLVVDFVVEVAVLPSSCHALLNGWLLVEKKKKLASKVVRVKHNKNL
jgi:hypothetical protein